MKTEWYLTNFYIAVFWISLYNERQYDNMSVTAVQISERRQKVKTTVSDESIKMRKFISMTMTMLKIGFIGFGGGSALITAPFFSCLI